MAMSLVTPPANEPVTLQEAKDHLRVAGGADDALISELIVAAREMAEAATWRALITQTWNWTLDDFGGLARGVPKAPLQSVTSITYIDGAGAAQVLDPAAYKVDAVSQPGRIVPAYGQCWPAARAEINAVTVRIVAGYGSTGAAVPRTIRQGMLLALTDLYENRQSEIVGAAVSRFTQTAERLWFTERVWR
jgi:uncharacterized phiE125 gp8 family phage protein